MEKQQSLMSVIAWLFGGGGLALLFRIAYLVNQAAKRETTQTLNIKGIYDWKKDTVNPKLEKIEGLEKKNQSLLNKIENLEKDYLTLSTKVENLDLKRQDMDKQLTVIQNTGEQTMEYVKNLNDNFAEFLKRKSAA